MFGRTARWDSCVRPASAVLRDAFAFPAFAFGVRPAGEAGACTTASCEPGACDVSQGDADAAETPTYRLAVDVAEEKRDVGKVWVITANVPGFGKDNIAIEVKEGLLSIEATRPTSTPSAGTTVYRRERRLANFIRRIQLPETAADDGVVATLAEGVLTIVVPQKPEAQPRKIAID